MTFNNKNEHYELYNMDATVLMKKYPDKHFDIAIVDPDFGLGDKIANGGTWAAKYKTGDGDLGGKPDAEYWQQLFRVSKNQIVWGGNYFIDVLYPTRCFLIWDKLAHMDTLADCEQAWTSFDKNAKIFRHARNTEEERIHITQKPIKLYEWILKNHCKAGDKILDTHLGSASIAIAVFRHNMKHNSNLLLVGSEISIPRYDAALLRVNKYIKEHSPASEEPTTFYGQHKLL